MVACSSLRFNLKNDVLSSMYFPRKLETESANNTVSRSMDPGQMTLSINRFYCLLSNTGEGIQDSKRLPNVRFRCLKPLCFHKESIR